MAARPIPDDYPPLTPYISVDATFAAAIEAGAEAVQEVENRFYGDRAGQFLDPWGHRWSIATHIEDVPQDELLRRAEDLFG